MAALFEFDLLSASFSNHVDGSNSCNGRSKINGLECPVKWREFVEELRTNF